MSIFSGFTPEVMSRQQAEQNPSDEAHLSQLALQQMGAGVLVYDSFGRIVLENSTARLFLGPPAEAVAAPAWPPGWKVTGRDPSSSGPETQILLTEVVTTEKPLSLEIVVPATSAEPSRHLLASATPLVPASSSGRPGTVLVMHDITARIQAENTIIQAKHQATRASEAKGNFLSAMSHELRTPLNAILGFTQLLRREASLSPEHASFLDLINSSGEHLVSVINEVLDLSKIEAGEHSLDQAVVAVAAQVDEVAAILRPRAAEKNLELEVVCDWRGSARIDAGKLRQILFNLLGNAIKFTSQGKVSVRVSLGHAISPSHSRLQIQVEDTGAGMTPSDLARIFEPFFRAEVSSAQPGTGLGLTITRQYVELLGGVITATSTRGSGSCFSVELPVEVIDQVAPVERLPAAPEGDLAPSSGMPVRVMVVEDHRTNANLLRRILTNAGFLVRVAETGPLAIETFTEWQPHFIWMDVMMQGMDGKEATRAIRALPGGREVKIVALSACSFREQGAEMLAAGCDDYLTKPSPAKTLIACMARHLGLALSAGDPRPPAASSPLTSPSSGFHQLPEHLQAELRAAILSLDSTKISAAIDRLRSVAPEVALPLSKQAERLNYTALFEAISTVNS